MADVVGRADEVALVTGLFDDVEQGRAATIVVQGVAGVGKSHLLDHVAGVAGRRGWTVVRAAGTEFEQEMAFTGLASIVGTHLDVVDQLDPRYANALRAALALDDGSTPQLAVGVALLSFLATMAERHPVLVVVDDLQWLDQASAGALHFALHRLDADRVAAVMGSRPEHLPVLARSMPSLTLTELTESDVAALLEPLGVSADVAKRCSAVVGGNPLGLLELARRLSSDQRSGRVDLPDPLPLAQRLADAFQPLLDALAIPTRRALEVAAIAGTHDLAVIRAALRELDVEVVELEVAEDAGLIELGADGLAWVHPLAKAAVQNNAGRRATRVAHRAIADVLDPARHPDQIAWHLASASSGPDEVVARRLTAVAADARRRGAVGAAAQAYDRAAQLSESDGTRFDRLLEMGRCLWAGGTIDASADRLREAVRLAADPMSSARLAVVLGEAEVWTSGVTEAVELLETHARRVSDLAPGLSAELRVQAAGALIVAGNVHGALEQAEEAAAAAARSGQPTALFAAGTVRGVARLLAGEPSADAELEPLTSLTLALLPTGEAGIEMAAQLLGFSSGVAERWDQTEELTAGVIRIGDELGMVGLMAIATVVRADARFRSGRWTEALADLTNVVTMAEATGERVVADFAAAYLARVEGARGMDLACRQHASAALAVADELGLGSAALWARHGLAVLELGAGRPEAAVEHLDVMAIDVNESGLGDPGALWWRADHVEALLACGRDTEAREEAQRLAERAERTGRGFGLAAAVWCRALVQTEGTDVDEELGRAVAGFADIPAPFERARVLLGRGRLRLSRGGDQAGGRRDLAEARTIFDRLGAQPWASQARQALGDVTPGTEPGLAARLTAGELRVALCVGAGLSNRDAAEQLFLSVKTIDYHLQNAYRKLEISSRTQLAALVARERTIPG